MKTLFGFLFLFFLSTAQGQTLQTAQLDAYFDTLSTHNKCMGNVCIWQNGKALYTHSFGFADLEAAKPNTVDTKFRVGSISKTFTSVLIMKAVEEGKLSLDATLNTYFPRVQNSGQITLHQMLLHQSGIHSFTDEESYLEWNTQAQTQESLLERIYGYPADFEPGKNTAYSNSNFILLGYILEKIYGQSYADLVKKKIVKPLGLAHTYVGGKIQTNKNECHSYGMQSTWQRESETDMSIPGGAGAIVSTASDLARFIEGLMSGKLLSTASLKSMQEIKGEFGFGMYTMPYETQLALGHGGAIDGFVSQWLYLPDSKLIVTFTLNGINYSGNTILVNLLDAAHGKNLEIPVFTTYTVSEEDFARYPGHYAKQDFPLEIDIRVEDGKLFAQATGQDAFALDPTGLHEFREDRFGIVLIFHPETAEMELQQGGQTFVFVRTKEGE